MHPALSPFARRRQAAALLASVAALTIAAACSESATAPSTAAAQEPATAQRSTAQAAAGSGAQIASAGAHVVRNGAFVFGSAAPILVKAMCPSGEVATGGGFFHPASLNFTVSQAKPEYGANNVPVGWSARFYNTNSNTNSSGSAHVYAICVPTQ